MKMKYLLKIFFLSCSFFYALTMNGNVGQPGLWKAGGGISLLLPEDMLASKFISMDSERIDIQVYSGFAVIHGHYTLTNQSNQPISFSIGYPINQLWNRSVISESPFGFSILLDSLAGFEVTMDGIASVPNVASNIENWVTWPIQFLPNQMRTVEVTYIAPTQQAKMTNMSGKREDHGLIYVFETGASWKNNIQRAELFIHFLDGLSTEDVTAIRPNKEVKYLPEGDILYFSKQNWKPKAGENFYLMYATRSNKYYSFEEGVEDKEFLFKSIKKIASEEITIQNPEPFESQDILDASTTSYYGKIILFVLGGVLILFGILLTMVILFMKNYRK
ncbi:MAG: hypothetical protein P1U56_17080 [Saprospiraceae bacterium]|nr:hypothetical protein [Saprospiraceae bacterium]